MLYSTTTSMGNNTVNLTYDLFTSLTIDIQLRRLPFSYVTLLFVVLKCLLACLFTFSLLTLGFARIKKGVPCEREDMLLFL